MNQVTIVGRLVTDPKKHSDKLTYIKVAIKNTFKKTPDGKPGADFIDVTLFNQAANFANEYVKKGDLVAITAHLSNYDKEENGKKITKLQIIADKFDKLISAERK